MLEPFLDLLKRIRRKPQDQGKGKKQVDDEARNAAKDLQDKLGERVLNPFLNLFGEWAAQQINSY